MEEVPTTTADDDAEMSSDAEDPSPTATPTVEDVSKGKDRSVLKWSLGGGGGWKHPKFAARVAVDFALQVVPVSRDADAAHDDNDNDNDEAVLRAFRCEREGEEATALRDALATKTSLPLPAPLTGRDVQFVVGVGGFGTPGTADADDDVAGLEPPLPLHGWRARALGALLVGEAAVFRFAPSRLVRDDAAAAAAPAACAFLFLRLRAIVAEAQETWDVTAPRAKLATAQAHKAAGARAFAAHEFRVAARHFRRARAFVEHDFHFAPSADDSARSEDDEKCDALAADARALRVLCAANLAAAQLALARVAAARTTCVDGLKVAPDHLKLQFRLAVAERRLGNWREADRQLRPVLERAPRDPAVRKELATLRAEQKAHEGVERALFAKALAKPGLYEDKQIQQKEKPEPEPEDWEEEDDDKEEDAVAAGAVQAVEEEVEQMAVEPPTTEADDKQKNG